MAQAANNKHASAQTKSRPGYAPAVVLFLAGSLFLAWPWLSGAVTIPWDAKAHFYPQLAFLARSLHSGQSPFWTPNIFGGHPQIADPQSLIFSPPHLLLAILDRTPSFVAFDAVAFGMLAAGGLALMMLFRDRDWHPAGALVAALAFAFGASNAWRIQHIGQVLSIAWFAIALWLLLRALDRRSAFWGALAGLAAGFMVAGRDQVAWLCTMILVFVAIWRILEGGLVARRLGSLIRPLGAGLLTGVAVIAIPVAMTIAFAAYSNRAEITFAGAAAGSLHPAALVTFLSANLFGVDGPITEYWGPPNPDFWGDTGLALARNMAAVYMGALPIVAIVTLGVLRGGLASREIRMFSIAALAMLLYALGRYTPAFAYAFHIPGADLFRRPADATFPLGALLAIIAGWLTHRVAIGDWRASPRRAALEAIVVGAAFAFCVLLALEKGRLASALPVLALTALWLWGSLAFLWALPRLGARSGLALVALTALLAADLRANNGPNESTALPPAVYEALRPNSTDPTLAMIERALAVTEAPNRRDRVEMAAIDFHWPNVSLVRGFDHWLGYNPLRLKWFADATGAIDHVAVPDQRRFSPLFARYASPMADLLGVRWVATGPPARELDKSLAPGDLVEVGRTKAAHFYENPGAMPRVLFATRAQSADFDRMIATGDWPQVDFQRTVLLEHPPAQAPAGAAGSEAQDNTAQDNTAQGKARLLSYRNTEVIVDAESPAGGYVVLNDVWHPWWRVEIDGARAPLLRANVIFRAVAVPPGEHRVRFVFRPFAGLWAQMLGR